MKSRYADLLGPIIAVNTEPISLTKDNDRTYLRVGETVEVIVHNSRLSEEAHPGSSLWYDPFVTLKEPVLATIVYSRFSGMEFRHRWWLNSMGISGFTSDFVAAH